ncbi:MAG: tRNA (N6-isopentenyl adenosine(37)-C2)-methylthiotransferase MiaB, partial [Bacilli bacterium]|nr:tRNA (N6-isopentenyl adenosine(37)-C2)-methylthiotransferase MiaB [Bacilli bacterium]
MNEKQRIHNSQVKEEKNKTEKDYSQYFQTVYVPPSLKEAKKRGKEDIAYHKDFTIDSQFLAMGNERKFFIRTFGCQMNEHDTEVMAGIFLQLG